MNDLLDISLELESLCVSRTAGDKYFQAVILVKRFDSFLTLNCMRELRFETCKFVLFLHGAMLFAVLFWSRYLCTAEASSIIDNI